MPPNSLVLFPEPWTEGDGVLSSISREPLMVGPGVEPWTTEGDGVASFRILPLVGPGVGASTYEGGTVAAKFGAAVGPGVTTLATGANVAAAGAGVVAVARSDTSNSICTRSDRGRGTRGAFRSRQSRIRPACTRTCERVGPGSHCARHTY